MRKVAELEQIRQRYLERQREHQRHAEREVARRGEWERQRQREWDFWRQRDPSTGQRLTLLAEKTALQQRLTMLQAQIVAVQSGQEATGIELSSVPVLPPIGTPP
eukprot:327842_1